MILVPSRFRLGILTTKELAIYERAWRTNDVSSMRCWVKNTRRVRKLANKIYTANEKHFANQFGIQIARPKMFKDVLSIRRHFEFERQEEHRKSRSKKC